MKREIMKIKIPPIPENIFGRKRKNGKADKRYVNSFLAQKEFMGDASGVSDILKSGALKNEKR